VSNRNSGKLAEDLMRIERDFTLQEIYLIVCRPPHQEMLTPTELHSRCSRSIGEARALLKKEGYVLVPGNLRHSYKAVKRRRG
jgi:hypothetical protein